MKSAKTLLLGGTIVAGLALGAAGCAPNGGSSSSSGTGGSGQPGSGGSNNSGGGGSKNSGSGGSNISGSGASTNGSGSGGSNGSGTSGTGGAVTYPAGGPAPAALPIRRLTNTEYTAATADLFPGFSIPPPTFVNDTKTLNFLNISSSQNATQVRMEQYQGAAEMITLGDGQTPQVWTGVVADPTALTGCDVTAKSELVCAQPYLYDLGKRAYRRPLTDAEKTALWGLFSNTTAGDYKTRLSMAIEGILISPNFLFRPELGDSSQTVASGILGLTPYEIATRLSFFINGSTPDATLMASADSGKLLQPDEVMTQLTRLMAMPRSQTNLVRMHELWLGIDTISALTKDPVAFPKFNSLLAVEMGQETRGFIQNVMFTQNGTFNDLLQSTYTYGNTDIASFYGVNPPAGITATSWGRIDLPPAQRMGLLTQPSLLATLAKDGTGNAPQDMGTAIRRGKFVLQQLLCRPVPEPSSAIVAMFQPLDLTKTARDQAKGHEFNAVCAACHTAIDPLGLPFEHYDMIGSWRDTDRGMAIDVSGQITDADGTNAVTFNGVPELAKLVAQRSETRACYLQEWFQYATGKLVTPDDQDYLNWLTSGFTSDKKLVDLVADLVTSNSFRQLKIVP
jgi:Protein of unknown function (DUF1592)/Protein of unknown function (DUF1588)/Protein of unknown function (DUF1595)/Protein of unknown function (DUF1587)/Protein of unknown function (DUF1585)